MNTNECQITGLKIVNRFTSEYLDRNILVKSYQIEINLQKIHIKALNLEEIFANYLSDGKLDWLIEHRPKLIDLIYNDNDLIKGIFAWDQYKNYSNVIQLESILDTIEKNIYSGF